LAGDPQVVEALLMLDLCGEARPLLHESLWSGIGRREPAS
jgi:hypothetical protein